MHDLYAISRFPQPFTDLFRNHHRAMLAAGTTKRNRQVALSLVDVMRQQVHQQFRYPLNEFFCLRKRPDVLGYARMTSRERAKLRHEMRIGQKAHVEHQVGILRHPMFESEAHA